MENFALIGSGSVLSAAVDLRKRNLLGFSVPVINSGDIALQGSFDGSSASFMRIMDLRAAIASGDLRFSTVAGSRMVLLPAGFVTPPYVKFETIMATGSAQTDNRSFALLTRPL